jgi:hypothetical protein
MPRSSLLSTQLSNLLSSLNSTWQVAYFSFLGFSVPLNLVDTRCDALSIAKGHASLIDLFTLSFEGGT